MHQTRVDIVMAHVITAIETRKLVTGSKLSSLRKLAETLNVSKSTIVEAYDRLCAEGLVEARRGSGFYVVGHVAPLELTKIQPPKHELANALSVSRVSLEMNDAFLMPGCGWLPRSWLPESNVRKAIRAVSRDQKEDLTAYGTAAGHSDLRRLILRKTNQIGLNAKLDNIFLSDSGTHAIDLICRYFLNPGDSVLVDAPCYFNFQALLNAHQVNIIGVPFTKTGPDVMAFEVALKKHKPRLYVTNAGIQNPTGASLSPVTAHRVLNLAEAHDLIIVEDDIFIDFENEQGHAPRYATLDGLNRVIYIGSFSKTLTASLRCGYVIGKQAWVNGLIDLKVSSSFGGNPFASAVIYQLLKNGSYKRYLAELNLKLANARVEVIKKLEAIGLKPWVTPKAGLYIWCELPTNIKALHVAMRAYENNIMLTPSDAFFVDDSDVEYLRFNVAQCEAEKIFTILAKILNE